MRNNIFGLKTGQNLKQRKSKDKFVQTLSEEKFRI